jgi:V/A-type H+-transporting ATPase subunit I
MLFGHTLVLLLSALGAFVHPLRLTFVEFYKNSGFSGGGKEYKPFTNK